MSHPPLPIGQDKSLGCLLLSAFVVTYLLALDADCSQTRPYIDISNIINNLKITSDSCNFFQILCFELYTFENPLGPIGLRAVRERVKHGKLNDNQNISFRTFCILLDYLDNSCLVSKLGKLLNYHLSDFQKNIGCPALVVASATVVLSSSVVSTMVVVTANIYVRLINQISLLLFSSFGFY